MVFTKKHYYSDYSDIFISERLGNTWSEPRPLEAINSKWNEVFLYFKRMEAFAFPLMDGKVLVNSISTITHFIKKVLNIFRHR